MWDMSLCLSSRNLHLQFGPKHFKEAQQSFLTSQNHPLPHLDTDHIRISAVFVILMLHLLCVCTEFITIQSSISNLALHLNGTSERWQKRRSEPCLPDFWSMKRRTLGPSLTTPKSSTTRGDLRALHAPTSSLLNLFKAIWEDRKKEKKKQREWAHFETRQWKKHGDVFCFTFLTAKLKPVLTSRAPCTSP